MKTHHLASLLAAAALLLLAACGPPPGPAAPARETLIVGTEGAYPPFNLTTDKGELDGFEIDLARALAKQMGADCQFVSQSWDGLVPALQARRFDCIMAGMSITAERQASMDFSDRYCRIPARFVARKGAALAITPEGLAGKTIGVQRSTTHATYLEDNYGSKVTIKLYDTQDSANLDLLAGRLDLTLSDSIILLDWLNTPAAKDYEFVGPPLTDLKWFGDGMGAAFRKGDTAKREKYNQALAALRANGEYARVAAKWFPPAVDLGMD